MALNRKVDYIAYLYTCNRCRGCAVDHSPEMRPVCPSYSHFKYFTYSGGGKGYVAQGILEKKVKATPESSHVAMNCLLCGACGAMCPPGFDTVNFIRDLRDYIATKGVYINDEHKKLLEKAREGDLWGKSNVPKNIPRFTGDEELLVYLGCKEKANTDLLGAVGKILDAAEVSWGVLKNEPCCGAPLEDLGDMKAFEKRVKKNIKLLNSSGAEMMLTVCPHCSAAMFNDYPNIDDLEVDITTLPSYIAELIADERIKLGKGKKETITYHDPCKLGRFLEMTNEPREIIDAIDGVELAEMERTGQASWCCGSGAWATKIVPELAASASKERIEEARNTGADKIVTACSYCTDSLKKASKGKQSVAHLAELVADRLK